MPKSHEVVVDSVIEVRCPCGGTVHAGYARGTPVVLHNLPLCDSFIELPPDRFLVWRREAMATLATSMMVAAQKPQ
jgi:hypothetical protein